MSQLRSDKIMSDISLERLGLKEEGFHKTGNPTVDGILFGKLSDATIHKRYGITEAALKYWSTDISAGRVPICGAYPHRKDEKVDFHNDIDEFITYVLHIVKEADTNKAKSGSALRS